MHLCRRSHVLCTSKLVSGIVELVALWRAPQLNCCFHIKLVYMAESFSGLDSVCKRPATRDPTTKILSKWAIKHRISNYHIIVVDFKAKNEWKYDYATKTAFVTTYVSYWIFPKLFTKVQYKLEQFYNSITFKSVRPLQYLE